MDAYGVGGGGVGGGGGGGGGGIGGAGDEKGTSLEELVQRAYVKGDISSYEINLNNYFQDLLRDFNDRDIEGIRRHLETIISALKQEMDIISLLYGGSIQKHTYVNGLSDVDVLAILTDSKYEHMIPKEVISTFADKLQQRFPYTNIKTGNLAVTVEFSDGHQIQVLPAIRTQTGIRIAHPDDDRWSDVIRPDRFANKLTEINQSKNGRVVPVIKLFKAINAQLPKDARLSGYHIESLAINAFEIYKGKLNYKDMLLHFTNYASDAVKFPITDRTGQSLHVCDYLGNFGSLERDRVSREVRRIHSTMKKADELRSLEPWKNLMGD